MRKKKTIKTCFPIDKTKKYIYFAERKEITGRYA